MKKNNKRLSPMRLQALWLGCLMLAAGCPVTAIGQAVLIESVTLIDGTG